jgi:tetratricopeptide (TPR) repeat protein
VPERFGPWEVLGVLAHGGSAVVLRARDPQSGEEVALKRFGAAGPPGDVARERFRREAAVLSRLRHPHLVPVRAAGEERGVPWLALALVRGESLQARLERAGPLAPRAAAEAVRDLALALHYAHGCGVLHRDVKPDNVLIDERGRFLLTDFGLALDLESAEARLSRTGVMLGTPGYWSPEQARGERRAIDARTDVWGLGATLFACLTGQPPFGGATLQETIAALLAGTPAFPPGLALDAELRAVCLSCLEADPARRPPSADALARALTLWLGRRGGPSGGARARRRRVVILAGLVVVAAGLVALGARLRGRTPSPAAAGPIGSAATSSGVGSPEARRGAAREATRRGAWAAAEEAWTRVLEGGPADVEALVARAEARYGQHRARESGADAERALALAPADPVALAAWVRAALSEGPGEAERRLVVAQERAGDAAAVLVAESELRFARRDLEGTLAAAERAVAADASFAHAWRMRGLSRFYLRRFEAARDDLETAARLLPERRDGWHLLGYCAHVEGRHAEAIELLGRAIACGAAGEDHYYRARSRVLLGADAVDVLDDTARAVELDPRAGRNWALRAESLLSAGRLQEAATDATRAIAEGEDDPQGEEVRLAALRVRALARGALLQSEGALIDLRRLLDARPDDPGMQTMLAETTWEAGDPGLALGALDRLEELAPGRLTGRALRVLVCADSGQWEALPAALAALGDPPPAATRFVRGQARLHRGDLPGAEEDCSSSIAAIDDHGPVRSYFTREALAAALGTRALARALLERDPGQVEADCERAIRALGPDSRRVPQAWLARAVARLARGDRAGARADLDEARARLGRRAATSPLSALIERYREQAR